MKIKVRILQRLGEKRVEADGYQSRSPTEPEMLAVLEWAESKGLTIVSFKRSRLDKIRRCTDCGGLACDSSLCDWCFRIDGLLSQVNSYGQPVDGPTLEYRAQLAERVSVRLAEVAIELQSRVKLAVSHDPIEIIDNTSLFYGGLGDFEETLPQLATGADLDRMAEMVGVWRASAGIATMETDAELRQRVISSYEVNQAVPRHTPACHVCGELHTVDACVTTQLSPPKEC